MKSRLVLGAWSSVVLALALPMCNSEEPSEGVAGAGGEASDGAAGGEPSAGGAKSLPPHGGATVAGQGGIGGAVDTNRGGTHQVPSDGGQGGWTYDDPCADTGAGGLYCDAGPRRCGGGDDGIACCHDLPSCHDLPDGWCGTGGQGPVASACCDAGQRQSCELEQGESMGWFIVTDTCRCSLKRCDCDRGNLP